MTAGNLGQSRPSALAQRSARHLVPFLSQRPARGVCGGANFSAAADRLEPARRTVV